MNRPGTDYHLLREAGVDDEGEPSKIRCSCGWQWRAGRDDFREALKAHLAAFGIDSNPVGTGMPNCDLVETWEVATADEAAHFGLPWEDGDRTTLLLLNQRQTGSHATWILPLPGSVDAEPGPDRVVTVAVEDTFVPGWPTEWPEHDTSNCGGHGAN